MSSLPSRVSLFSQIQHVPSPTSSLAYIPLVKPSRLLLQGQFSLLRLLFLYQASPIQLYRRAQMFFWKVIHHQTIFAIRTTLYNLARYALDTAVHVSPQIHRIVLAATQIQLLSAVTFFYRTITVLLTACQNIIIIAPHQPVLNVPPIVVNVSIILIVQHAPLPITSTARCAYLAVLWAIIMIM
jgi:hypothetical protein